MFRNGFDFKVNDSIFIDQNGRYIFLDLTVYEQCLTLVCLYGYNTDKPELFTEILQKSELHLWYCVSPENKLWRFSLP
jgi:hypothetical protein